jgi:hypothetical protein
MVLYSDDVPQADVLEDVINTVEAVAGGATSFQSIAAAIGKGDRQGRYYRLAAEQLGLIAHQGTNISSLTTRGREFLQLPEDARRVFLADLIFENEPINAVFSYINSHPNCSKSDIVDFLISESIGVAIAGRRSTTILNWLSSLGVIRKVNNRYNVVWRPAYDGQAIEELVPADLGQTTPYTTELRDAENIWDGTFAEDQAGTLIYQVDNAARKRATVVHQQLVRAMIDVIRNRGYIPRFNRSIDLTVELPEGNYLFEMKSCNARNMTHQIRYGISQLYEYRYIHQGSITEPQLWLVLEQAPENDNQQWYIDYLISDRGINVCWIVDEGTFSCPEACREALQILINGQLT